MAQILSDPLHTLHMGLAENASEVRVVKALREARKTLGDTSGEGLEQAIRAIRTAGGPIFVGVHADNERIAAAAEQLSQLSNEQAIPLINWTEHDLTDEAEDDTLGHQVALVLMGLTDGKPVGALIGAFNLRAVLGDGVYSDAMDALIEAYPALEDVAEANDLLDPQMPPYKQTIEGE